MKSQLQNLEYSTCSRATFDSYIGTLVEQFRNSIPGDSKAAKIINSRGPRAQLIATAKIEGFHEFAFRLDAAIKLALGEQREHQVFLPHGKIVQTHQNADRNEISTPCALHRLQEIATH